MRIDQFTLKLKKKKINEAIYFSIDHQVFFYFKWNFFFSMTIGFISDRFAFRFSFRFFFFWFLKIYNSLPVHQICDCESTSTIEQVMIKHRWQWWCQHELIWLNPNETRQLWNTDTRYWLYECRNWKTFSSFWHGTDSVIFFFISIKFTFWIKKKKI